MALTFFWRCEGTTLDGTHDFSAGDTTASAVGGVSISSSSPLAGSNSLLTTTTNEEQRYNFDGASIFSHAEGAVGFLFRPESGGSPTIVIIQGTTPNNQVAFEWGTSGNFTLRHRNAGTGENRTAVTTGNAATTGATYFIVGRWDTAADLLRIEIYDSSGTLLDSAETNLSMTAASDTYTARFGKGGSTTLLRLDTIFIADAYDEPLEDNFDITSYTQYGSGGTAVPVFKHIYDLNG